MDDYLSKPITPEGLATVLARWVRDVEEIGDEHAVTIPSTPSFPFAKYVKEVEELLRRVGGDRGLLLQVGEVFGAEYPQMMAAVRSAMSRQDVEGLRRAAHTLKGAVGNMAAQRAYEAAFRLEQMGNGGILVDGNTTLQQVEHEVNGFRSALNTVLQDAAQEADGR